MVYLIVAILWVLTLAGAFGTGMYYKALILEKAQALQNAANSAASKGLGKLG